MTFTYDHLNATSDMEKEKRLGSHKMFQLLSTYLMISIVLGQTLFEDFDASSKRDGDLKAKLKRVNKGHEFTHIMLNFANKRMSNI